MERPNYYFTTRDLLLMAALAALGGITSTAINTIGDAVQSVLGFAGTTQWAAGLHVLWLTLAVGLTNKLGAGTVTGLLKGGVELLTGNTHGVLVLLVDLVAGVLVDLGMLPFRRKDRLLPFVIGAGLASASNVFVFQLFAALPADVLAYGALLLIGLVAAASGVLFGGVLGYVLMSALQRSGVIKSRAPVKTPAKAWLYFLALAIPMIAGLAVYLRAQLRGPEKILVTGAVEQSFTFPEELSSIDEVQRTVDRQGVEVKYSGYRLKEVLDHAHPETGADAVLVMASDGYAFFIAFSELESNETILLSPQELDGHTSFDIVGPRSQKAWVRSVERLVVVGESVLPVSGAVESQRAFDPQNWQEEMDSVGLELASGTQKVQGVPLGAVLSALDPVPDAFEVVVESHEESLTFELAYVLEDDGLRIFSLVREDGIEFVLGRMSGEVLLEEVSGIVVR